MRKLASIAVTAGLLVALSACSTPQSQTFADGCSTGGNAKLVTAAGPLEGDPAADFPTPLVSKAAELSVLSSGDGAAVRDDAAVETTVSVYYGADGQAVQSQSGPLLAVPLRSLVQGTFPLTEALVCAPVGSRVVTTGTNTQLFGEQGLGLPADTTLVVVADITKTFPGRATGADQIIPTGMPSIVLAPNGRPGFTFASDTPPTDLRIADLKTGNGATVKQGDSVVVNYTGIEWAGDQPFDTTWDTAAPRTVVAADGIGDPSTRGVIPGFAQALIGAKVGSQVLAVIPPKFGYPAGSAPASIGDGATLVFVIDILDIQTPTAP